MNTTTFRSRYFLLFLLCLLWSGLGSTIRSQAQGYTAPSPDAMALAKQASNQVSHYTGTLGVSIPLAKLSGRELSISASLNYNGAGNKVAEVASSEGLGWSLSVGGLITRIVRGDPDDLANGFCTPNKSDTEPDMFIFNFMGRSGKFILDRNGNPILYPYQDLIINAGICIRSTQTWEIIDESGTRYIFGSSFMDRETLTSRLVTGGPSTTYTSAWHLSKIISPNGTDEITFSYTGSTISYVNYYFSKNDACTNDASVKDISMQITSNIKHVSLINTSAGSINFDWNSEREDISGGKSLRSILVVNRQGEHIHKLRFEYSYFQSPGCVSELCKRLKLDKIYDLSSSPLFNFEYNTTINLPARNSKNFDHWGYYNNNTVDSWIPAVFGLTGASREPDPARIQANLLLRVNQRGGAYKWFNYEIHSGVIGGQVRYAGGARIKSIQTNDGLGNQYLTEYAYVKTDGSGSGQLFSVPSYYAQVSLSDLTKTIRVSHSYSDIWDLNGSYIGYSRVEETTSVGGKTVYSFTNYNTNPDIPATSTIIFSDGVGFGFEGTTNSTSFFWERGNPLSIIIYNNQNQIVSEEKFEYIFNHPNKTQISAQKTTLLSSRCGSDNDWIRYDTEYNIISRPFTLRKKITDLYDQENPARKVTTVTEYGYDSNTYQLTSTTEYNAATPSEKYISISRYANHADYSNSNPSSTDIYQRAVSTMRARHMQSSVVEQQRWIERNSVQTLLGATLNLYKLVGSNSQIVVPAISMASEKVTGTYQSSQINAAGTFVIPASFKNTGSFDTYDNTTGKLLQATSRDGLVAQYTYDHNQTVVKTATVNPGAGAQTTTYEYKPLVGVTKQTDANGQFVTSEYDALGRLRLIKDQDGNIRERYRYHYANETPGFVINLNVNRRQAITNQELIFSVWDIFVSTGGSTQISWNMGNGTVFNDNRQFFYFSYPTAGTYTVTFTLTSNEYPPVIRTTTITVTPPLQATICVDGPQGIDLCQVQEPYYGSCTTLNNYPYAPTELTANVVPGTGCAGDYTYSWEWRSGNSSYWNYMGNTRQASLYIYQTNNEAFYEIRCTVVDACGNSITASEYASYYRSNGCTSMPHLPERKEDEPLPVPSIRQEDPSRPPTGSGAAKTGNQSGG